MLFESVALFEAHLIAAEKSTVTVEKYMRDVKGFVAFAGERALSGELTGAYKAHLIGAAYAPRSVNSMLASLHSFFDFLGRPDCKVKTVKLQKEIYCPAERELTKAEYTRLVKTAEARGDERLALILQTLCGAGLRVSELEFITAEAVKRGFAVVSCKGKTRKVFLVPKLQKRLMKFIKETGVSSGAIFRSRTGKMLNRTTVWREMKSLCRAANVCPTKVFPHNLRHLFARVFYQMEKDIALLADILGHSSINTTRIYIISTGEEHRKRMEKMKLIL